MLYVRVVDMELIEFQSERNFLEVAFQKEFLNLGFTPALDDDVPIEPVDRYIWALVARISRLQTQGTCQITPEGLQVALCLLNLGLLLGATSFGNEIDG